MGVLRRGREEERSFSKNIEKSTRIKGQMEIVVLTMLRMIETPGPGYFSCYRFFFVESLSRLRILYIYSTRLGVN